MTSVTSITLKGTAIALAVSCVACASAPDVPEGQLARAQTSVEFAEQNDGQQFAPAALERARKQLDQAQTAVANEEFELALHLAERAELDAQLAMAETNHEKAVIALQEIEESIETLRREIARNQTS